MHNDNRNEPFPVIPRNGATLTVSVITALVTTGIAASNIVSNLSALSGLKQGTVTTPVPLPPEQIDRLVETWRGGATVDATGYATVSANVTDSDIVAAFVGVEWAGLTLTLLISVIALIGLLAMFAGRLRWNMLASLVIAGGAFTAIGSNVIQAVRASAGENLSVWLYANGGSWWEPGILAGIDFMSVAVGAVVVVLGFSIRSAARLAKEADGVY